MTIKMDRWDSKALEESIKIWGLRVDGEEIPEGRDNCPLCRLAESRNKEANTCQDCIIVKHTGKVMCLGTPYVDLLQSDKTRYKAEYTFLKSLRKYNPINKGDIVENTDGSYHMRLTDNGLSNLGNISWNNDRVKFRYVVVETGLQLPSSGSRYGKNSNDTIVRDVNSNEYIFTMARFLVHAEEEKEICSECGTEL